ncbi:hypothetical protein LTR33_000692 [Friedmanniomyces endolithicus]|nr:hypothetical protein LTR33_000692 [Friedmanniomyces endolithicus]
MTSPRQSYEHIPFVPAHALCDALTALQRRAPTPDDDVNLPTFAAHHRNCFLDVFGSAEIYDAVRDLISDATYWAKEEAYFEVGLWHGSGLQQRQGEQRAGMPTTRLVVRRLEKTTTKYTTCDARNTAIQPLFASSSSFTRCEASAASSPAPAATSDAQ